ncbi:hypothetical protein BN2497_13511 [Janthinobacterium sp. CG23_2]|nr:hypothetical protein BN2497_13511 [Janthinobacterium sp. CG23_2]CUU33153.1 hypothetical protein BN3177_13511 [Janthinobacterium sp. CG23_2]
MLHLVSKIGHPLPGPGNVHLAIEQENPALSIFVAASVGIRYSIGLKLPYRDYCVTFYPNT